MACTAPGVQRRASAGEAVFGGAAKGESAVLGLEGEAQAAVGGPGDRALLAGDQFVICAVWMAWLNIAFNAAVISAGEFAV